MRARLTTLFLGALLAASCASQGPAPSSTPSHAQLPKRPTRVVMISRAQVYPDIPPKAEPAGEEADGSRRYLLWQMRLMEHPDGSLERAPGLLPAGRATLLSVELPGRLGGGFLFLASSVSGTQIWRASGWLAPLQPLAQIADSVTEAIAGFDRLYLRSNRDRAKIIAIDPQSGQWTDVGRLPQPSRYGPMVFLDAWRAVAVVDVRGALATFDAGESWIPLNIQEGIKSLDQEGDRIRITTATGAYSLGAEGRLVRASKTSSTSSKPQPQDDEEASPSPARPLGRRPLRTAIVRGFPYSRDSAVVAHRGKLAEVEIRTGAIKRIKDDAYPDSYTECRGIRLGSGIGFVCGEQHGATAVFAMVRPFALEPVLRWTRPVAVMPSGNGALVVRAPCPGAPIERGVAQYCVRTASGETREVRFRGDLGAERVAALTDGRVAAIIAPRAGGDGRLVLLDGERVVTVPLTYKDVPKRKRALARRGLWLQGPTEVAPGMLGLWVEAGGPLMGVRVDLKGKVKVGDVQTPPNPVLVAGPFGLVWRNTGEGLETVDGGMSWKEIDLPMALMARGQAVRGCTAVGCVLDGWMRVGWGPARNSQDAEPADKPRQRYSPSSPRRSLSLTCRKTGRASPPAIRIKPSKPQPRPHRHVPPSRQITWLPFGSAPPPALKPEEQGVSGGRANYGDFRFRAYAWGPKGSDWSRTGRWLVRFENPYDPVSRPLATAPAVSPWMDDASARMALSSMTTALPDPGYSAAVLAWCRGSNLCTMYGVVPQEPPLEFSTTQKGLPMMQSAVRTEQGWTLLARMQGNRSQLWHVDTTGHATLLTTFPRVSSSSGRGLQLARRAHGSGVALVDRTGHKSQWILMPVDPTTGLVMEAVKAGPTDLSGAAPLCAAEEDGWVVEMELPTSPRLKLAASGRRIGGNVRARLRIRAGTACIEALTARGGGAGLGRARGHPRKLAGAGVPLSLWDDSENRKFELICSPDS